MTVSNTTVDTISQRVPLHGTSLIEAGAGTGKTYTIVDLFVRLLVEREFTVSQILVVTYTVAATAELRERIRSRLVEHAAGEGPGASRCRDAVRDFDRAAIVSIHGFCQRALREHAFESGSGFESELVTDSDSLLEEVAHDFWSDRFHAAPRYEVAYAVHARLQPSHLAKLAARLAARPDAELRPPRCDVPDIGPRLAALQVAHARAAKAWARDGDDVLELLAAAAEREDLYKNMYKAPVIRTAWRVAMDDAMGSAEPGVRRRFEQLQRLSRSGLRVKKGRPSPEHPFFDVCEELVKADEAVDEALEAWAIGVRHDFREYADRELARRKRERDVLFFDDLLQGLRDALVGDAGDALAAAIRAQHPVALIDEFQDTDPIQYEIFRRVWHEATDETALMLIGDPKQAIYAFRGADVFAYLDARGDAGDSVHGLRRNHRADPGLVEALNALFGSSDEPFARPEIPFAPALPRPEAKNVLTGSRIRTGLRFLLARLPEGGQAISASREGGPLVRAVAAEVARILAGRHEIAGEPRSAGDVAVLTRTNKQARAIQSALREHRIVSVLQSEESVFATNEARELERVMRALAEPESPDRLRAALATPLLGGTAEDLLRLEEDASGELWDAWTVRLRAGRQIWAERGFLQAFRFLWVECACAVRLLGQVGGERRVTNLLHLAELLQREAMEARLGPQALLYWFGRRRFEAEQTSSALAEDAQLRLESDAKAVQLLTVHRSKGLQYPVTICPFLWDGMLSMMSRERPLRFHDPETGTLVLDAAPPDESKSEAEREAHEENLRLLYVALTRAKHHCSVVWGGFKGAEKSPLAHFLRPEALGARKAPTLAQLRADLDRIVAAAPDEIVVEEWDLARAPVLRVVSDASPASSGALTARSAKRSYEGGWRVSSFSGLVAAAPHALASSLLDRLDAAAEEGATTTA